jgi:Mn-dependent DtxR family transcriptional regulator
MDKNTMVSVLVALFDLARMNRPANVERVAGRVGVSVEEARAALRGLEARGLADAMRARLTLTGLALAASAAQGREITFAHAA